MITLKLRHLVSTALLMFSAIFSSQALAKSPIYTSYFSDTAVSGYDTVAYFTENKPVEGDSKYSAEYQGAEWHFSSQKNLDAFKADPAKYAPQYGGYCAWAVAKNNTAKGDPMQWAIHNGKLYLNYNAEIRSKWFADKDALIVTADKNWPSVLN